MHQGLHFVARGFAPAGFFSLRISLKGIFELFCIERPVQNAASPGLERLTRAGPCAAGDRQQSRLLPEGQKSRHADNLLGPGRSKSTISVEHSPLMTSSSA